MAPRRVCSCRPSKRRTTGTSLQSVPNNANTHLGELPPQNNNNHTADHPTETAPIQALIPTGPLLSNLQSPSRHVAESTQAFILLVAVVCNTLVKSNTKKEYNNKVKEFKGFCNHAFQYLNKDENCYTVDDDKLYRFLFYHVFMTKKWVEDLARVAFLIMLIMINDQLIDRYIAIFEAI
ncbi:hypothetical protein ACA910_009635 [Epithemia clementina (nom. ined.)]